MNVPHTSWPTRLWQLLMALVWTLPLALATGWFAFLAVNALPGLNRDTLAPALLAFIPAVVGLGLGAAVGAALGKLLQKGLMKLGVPAGLSATLTAAIFVGMAALAWPHLPVVAQTTATHFARRSDIPPPSTQAGPTARQPAANVCHNPPPAPGSPAYKSWEQECK